MVFIIVDDRRDTSASVNFELTAGVAVSCHAVCCLLFAPHIYAFPHFYLCHYKPIILFSPLTVLLPVADKTTLLLHPLLYIHDVICPLFYSECDDHTDILPWWTIIHLWVNPRHDGW